MSTRSRSRPPVTEDELRLPRPPGVIRRFWARHPLLADILVALVCLLLTLGPAASVRPDATGGTPAAQAFAVVLTVLCVAMCVLLVWRRRWPVVVFAASFVVAFAFLFSATSIGPPFVFVTGYSLAVYRSSRAAWIGFGVGIGALAVTGLLLSLTGAVSISGAANSVVGQLVLALIGVLIGVNVGGRKRYLEAIIARSQQLLVERDQQALLAAGAERARIAREMHDIVSHSLTVVVALAEGATATDDADRARAATTQVAQTARGALREMRAMLGVLRDGTDASVPLAPLDDDAITAAVAAARGAGFPVTARTVTIGTTDAPSAVRLAAGRIVQEGLTNAMRHAPAATEISVVVTRGDDAVTVEVRNDGAIATARAGGYGLRGLRERVDHVGGTLEAGPDAPGRWRLWARLPIPDAHVKMDAEAQ